MSTVLLEARTYRDTDLEFWLVEIRDNTVITSWGFSGQYSWVRPDGVGKEDYEWEVAGYGPCGLPNEGKDYTVTATKEYTV